MRPPSADGRAFFDSFPLFPLSMIGGLVVQLFFALPEEAGIGHAPQSFAKAARRHSCRCLRRRFQLSLSPRQRMPNRT